MAKLKLRLIDLQELGIPTEDYMELVNVEFQLEDDVVYVICVLESGDYKSCNRVVNLKECKQIFNELKRIHGKECPVYYKEEEDVDVAYYIKMSDNENYVVKPEWKSPKEEAKIREWMSKIIRSCASCDGMEVLVLRDAYGDMFVSSIG